MTRDCTRQDVFLPKHASGIEGLLLGYGRELGSYDRSCLGFCGSVGVAVRVNAMSPLQNLSEILISDEQQQQTLTENGCFSFPDQHQSQIQAGNAQNVLWP